MSKQKFPLIRDDASGALWSRAPDRNPGSPEVQLFAGELFFDDSGGFDSRSQHILLGGHVVWLADSLHFIEVAEGGRGQRSGRAAGQKAI